MTTVQVGAYGEGLAQGITDERKRCAAIVKAAREGEIDGDLRSIIFRIEQGRDFPDPDEVQRR